MVIMSLKYNIRDLVSATADFGGRVFLILETTEDGYLALETKNKKRYPLKDNQIATKIGEINQNDPLLLEHYDDHDANAAEVYCNLQARTFPEESKKWMFLATLKVRDKISLVHRKTIYTAEFVRINLDKPLYPIRAKIKGLAHDFKLDSLILQNA